MSLTTLKDAEAQMLEFGLRIELLELDGRYHRAPFMDERRSRMSGYYKLREIDRKDEILVDGIFGSFKVSERPLVTDRRVSISLSDQRMDEIKKEYMRKLDIQREEEKDAHEMAAQRASLIWEDASEEGASPYLLRKKVQSYGLRFYKNSIVVPMVKEGRLTSLQSIAANGFKKYLPGGDIKGAMHIIKGSSRVALCEGYATGASIHEATGWSVAICFTANGLVSCAPYFKKKDVVICSDNDLATKEKMGKNVGLDAAKRAAQYLGCSVFVPEIDDLTLSDFNDVHVRHGLEEVRKQCKI